MPIIVHQPETHFRKRPGRDADVGNFLHFVKECLVNPLHYSTVSCAKFVGKKQRMPLQEGTAVWLKIGSPEMSVKARTKKNTYLCTWFVGNEINEYDFSEDQLTTENPANERSGGKRKPIFAGLFW